MANSRWKSLAVGVGIAGSLALPAYYLLVRRWHARWGATDEEVQRAMPGDDLVEDPWDVTTRAIIPFLNEAMYIVMEGVASAEDVDRALCLGYNLDKGPLAVADTMGLDTVMSWMEHLFRELGDVKYRPCPLLRKLVRAGHLGVKTGQGFFKYDENERRVE